MQLRKSMDRKLGEWYFNVCGDETETIVMLDRYPTSTCMVENHDVVFYDVPFKTIEKWANQNAPGTVACGKRFRRKMR